MDDWMEIQKEMQKLPDIRYIYRYFIDIVKVFNLTS